MMTVPAESPTLTPPAPEIVSPVIACVPLLVSAVVLPVNVNPMLVALAPPTGAEITTLEPEMPMLTAPAPSNDRLPAAIAPDVADVVVLPTA
jgi:hypothetical protein